MYLSPTGNDANDGFSAATPKKTIAKALHTIASDSLNAKTIYLAPGSYSSEDGQLFPLSMKSYVNLIGDSLSPPILINQRYEVTIISAYAPNKVISNLILEHGEHHPASVFSVGNSDNTVISNITFNPVDAITYAGLNINSSKCDIENIRLNGLTSILYSGIIYFCSYGSVRNTTINDCHNNGTEFDTEFSIFYASFDSLLTIARIYNGIIDIGCYEWDGVPNEDPNIPVLDVNTLSIYPNPFKANTNISFILPEKGDVKLDIFNVKGQKVISLCNGYQSKGMHKINWNGTSSSGKALSSGVYFASLSYKGKQITQKMIMIKQ